MSQNTLHQSCDDVRVVVVRFLDPPVMGLSKVADPWTHRLAPM
jgi:hypothetical protein